MGDKQATSIVQDDRQLIKGLTDEERHKLTRKPGVGAFQRNKLERDAKKNWDLFYKRNGDRFFKRRYWTRREFYELLGDDGHDDKLVIESNAKVDHVRYLFEVGCGCGDFALPLLDNQPHELDEHDRVKLPSDLFIYCCDISDKAIEILKSNDVYKRFESDRIKAFVADITTNNVDKILKELDGNKVDLMSLVFVLSALDPTKLDRALQNLSATLKPGALVFLRDYAIYDKAMLRFDERSKIEDQFYVRQDGTRAYFFTKQELLGLFERANFSCDQIDYVRRQTINNATGSSHSRIFLQAKFRKMK